jgi:hypothetical protein
MSPTTFARLVVAAVGAVIVPACGPKLPDEPPRPAGFVEQGFAMFPTPRTSDPPGTIYRKDREGRRFIVTTKLIPYLAERTGEEDFPAYSGFHDRRLSSGGLLGFLFGELTPVALGASGQRQVAFRVALYGARRQWTEDEDIEYALLVFEQCPSIDSGKTIDPSVRQILGDHVRCPQRLKWPTRRAGNRYFIIRETISADSLDFELADSTLKALGGVRALEEKIGPYDSSASPAVSWRDTRRSLLTRRFDTPRRIYFLAEEVWFGSAFGCDHCAGAGVPRWSRARGTNSGFVFEGDPDPELEDAPSEYRPM